jgi:hypothetical protein
MVLYNRNGQAQASKADPDEKPFSLSSGAPKKPIPGSNCVMKAKWMSSVVLTTLVAGGLFAEEVAHKKMTPMQIFMRQKLGYSEKIVEGITLENYSLVISNAAQLRIMTQSNAWMEVKHPVYLEKTDHFQADVTTMLDAARATNTPALLQAYTQVTADCVDCHQTFRSEQRARSAEKAQ